MNESEENALSIVDMVASTASTTTNFDLEIMEDTTFEKILEILNEIEGHTTNLRNRIRDEKLVRYKAKIMYHESHNNIAPGECGFMWEDVKKGEEEMLIWHQWKHIPVKQRCRKCRIGNNEIRGTEVEREEMSKKRIDSRKRMGWD